MSGGAIARAGDLTLIPRFHLVLRSTGIAPGHRRAIRLPGRGGESRGRITELVIAQLQRDRSIFHEKGEAPRWVRFGDRHLIDSKGRCWTYGQIAAALARDLRQQAERERCGGGVRHPHPDGVASRPGFAPVDEDAAVVVRHVRGSVPEIVDGNHSVLPQKVRIVRAWATDSKRGVQ